MAVGLFFDLGRDGRRRHFSVGLFQAEKMALSIERSGVSGPDIF
jgi:hypothetical protein